MVIAWFGALVLGRLPAWCAEFLSGYLRYMTRVYCYLLLLVDTYPPFQWSPPDYPVSAQLAPGRLNRAAVLFRLILYIPAVFMTAFLAVGWQIVALFFWLTVLILGRTPQPVFDATAAVVRYTMRAQAYFMMLLILIIVLGVLGYLGENISSAVSRNRDPSPGVSDLSHDVARTG